MKITQQELFNFIKDEKPNVSTYPSLPHMIEVITKKLGIKENEELRKLIKYQMMILVLVVFPDKMSLTLLEKNKQTKKTVSKVACCPYSQFLFY